MARDTDQDDELEISSLETRFVEKEDDGETLWEVLEIVAERGNRYRVRWAGFNPDTNEPWPLDWVPKEDCTDPLVLAWKRKKAEKKRGRKPIQSRASTTSKVSTNSSTTATRSTTTRLPTRKTVAAGTKRKHDERFQSADTSTSRNTAPDIVSSGRPKKKRKIASVSSSAAGASTSKVTLDQMLQEEEGPSGDEPRTVSRTEQPKPKPQKRPVKTPALVYDSASDEEPPWPKNGSKGSKLAHSKTTAPVARNKAVDSAPKLPSALSRSASRTSSTREARDKVKVEDDVPAFRRWNKQQNGISRKPKQTYSDSSDESPPPKPQPKIQPEQPEREEVAPIRAPSGSRRASSISSQAAKRASPSSSSFSPSPPPAPSSPAPQHSPPLSPRFPSPTTSLKVSNQEHQPNGVTHAAQDYRREDDEDSALEYADLPIPEVHPPSTSPLPPPAQPRIKLPLFLQSQSSSPSPSPPPAPSPTSTSRTPEPQFVPETEAEESQEPQHRDRDQKLIRSSPSKNSFVSRMKPRTPGSKKNIPDADLITSPLPFNEGGGSPKLRPTKRRVLHPIPRISPSKFLTLPSSTIESAITTGGSAGEEDSAIEQFDSPDKSSRGKKQKDQGTQEVPESTNESGSGNGSLPVPPAATNVTNKGLAMADAVKKAKQNGVATQMKATLTTIIEKEKEREKERGKSRGVDDDGDDEGGGGAVQMILEQFADSFVDYEGGLVDDSEPNQARNSKQEELTRTQDTSKNAASQQMKVYLRDEEEESTQDLLLELQQQQQQQPPRAVPGVDEGWAHPVVSVPEDSQQSQLRQSGDEMVDAVNSLEVAPKSSGPMTKTPQDPSSQLQIPSQLSSAKPPYTHSLDHSLEIPPTLSPTRLPVQPLISSSESQVGSQLESAMNLLNKKSEEISRLEILLTAAQTTIQSLEVDNATFKASSIAQENETLALITSLKSEQDRVAYAEKNAEVFRTQYYEASRFVSEVRAENRELQERAEVAESQATTGINGIRTMFEDRVKLLEGEVAYHRQIATFVMEQSRRTEDEEIRRRAAEYPEMKRKYEEMEKTMEGASGVIDTLERLVTMRDRDVEGIRKEKKETQERMEREINGLRDELEMLRGNVGVNGSTPKILVNGDMVTTTATPKVENVSGEIPVYRCLWRKDGRDCCDALFLTREDLQRHMENGGHLE